MRYYCNIRVNNKTNVPIFTLEQSLLQRSLALLTPCQPSSPACHLTWQGWASNQPSNPALHPNLPAIPPSGYPPSNQPSLPPALPKRFTRPPCDTTTLAWHTWRGTRAVLIPLRKLCVNMWSKSLLNPPLLNHRQISCVPPNILHMPQIWWDIPCTHPNILCIPCVLCDCTASLLCHGTHPNILSIPYGFPEYIGYSDGYLGCFNCWGKSQG